MSNTKNILKTIIRLSLLSLLIIALISSCKRDEGLDVKGLVKFYFIKKSNNLKSATYEPQVNYLKLSIENFSGVSQYKSDTFELFNFGDGYVSAPIKLVTGDYKLTEFEILDSAYKVVYAAPIAGSPKAYLVNEPLSINFTVQNNQVTNLAPEVLSVENSVPGDFGYPDFSFDVTKTFLITVYIYNILTNNLETTTSSLTILDDINVIYTRSLDSVTNQIPIQDGISNYTIKIEKPNYISFVHTYTQSELISAFDLPITIILKPDLNVGLVAYYPFNGNANDESGNGFNATVNGPTLTADRTGNPNRAYYFNGTINNYIGLPISFDYPERSVNIWFKSNNLSLKILYESDNQNIIYGQTEIDCNMDSIFYVVGSGSNVRGTKIISGEWNMATITVNGTDVKYYINGKFFASVNYNSGHSNNGGLNAFVGAGRNMDWNFNGIIDDIRIYNRAITNSEVQLLYNEKEK